MRATLALLLLLGALTGPALGREPQRSVEHVRTRMEHHLREVEQLAEHFERVLGRACPRFATPEEWRLYLDEEIDRFVLLMAHLQQAWIEAKHTGNDDVRRTAKAPRKRVERAHALLQKLSGCADDHGAPVSHMGMWSRIEREVRARQQQIALP